MDHQAQTNKQLANWIFTECFGHTAFLPEGEKWIAFGSNREEMDAEKFWSVIVNDFFMCSNKYFWERISESLNSCRSEPITLTAAETD